MKKMRVVFIGLFFTALGATSYAQTPYEHSVGAVVGNFNGVSYKTFFGSNLAFQADLGVKLNIGYWGMDVNPNLMYEQQFAKVNNFYWFVGGGASLGIGNYGLFGLNAIGGLEYKFSIPLTLQLDFRPGFGLWFGHGGKGGYFDWGLNLSARYTF